LLYLNGSAGKRCKFGEINKGSIAQLNEQKTGFSYERSAS
jgi:hypothetical protein